MDKLCLPDWKLRAFDGAVARELHCESGTVWITVAAEDITLTAGQSWRQDALPGSRLLVQAIDGDAVLWLRETASQPAPALMRWLRQPGLKPA